MAVVRLRLLMRVCAVHSAAAAAAADFWDAPTQSHSDHQRGPSHNALCLLAVDCATMAAATAAVVVAGLLVVGQKYVADCERRVETRSHPQQYSDARMVVAAAVAGVFVVVQPNGVVAAPPSDAAASAFLHVPAAVVPAPLVAAAIVPILRAGVAAAVALG